MSPNVAFTAADMKKLGIAYWKMDAESFEYPVKAVPWDPKDAVDPKLNAIRDARGYSYADIITVHPDHLPEFETVRVLYADLYYSTVLVTIVCMNRLLVLLICNTHSFSRTIFYV